MAFGRCEAINVGRNITIKDYQLISLNFLIKDMINNDFQLSTSKNVYFVLSSLSIWFNEEILVKPEEGLFESIVYEILNSYALDLKVIDKNGKTHFPLRGIPLDLLYGSKGIPSISSSQPFSVLEVFDGFLMLDPAKSNFVMIKETVADVFDQIIKFRYPFVDENVLREEYNRAIKFIHSNVYLSLNGYYTKDVIAYLEERDVIDLTVKKKKRIAFSKNVSPNLRTHVLSNIQSAKFKNVRRVVSEFWTPSIKDYKDYVELANSEFFLDKENVKYLILEYTLPKYPNYLYLKELSVSFANIPNPLIVGGRTDKILSIPNVKPDIRANADDAIYLTKYGMLTTTDGEQIKYDVADYRFVNSYPLTSDPESGVMKPLNSVEVSCSEDAISLYRGGVVCANVNATRLLGSINLVGELIIHTSNNIKNIKLPALVNYYGEDSSVCVSTVDFLVKEWTNLYSIRLLSSSADDTVSFAENYVDLNDTTYKLNQEFLLDRYSYISDSYLMPNAKVLIDSSYDVSIAEKDNKGSFVPLIVEPNSLITIRALVPAVVLPSVAIISFVAYSLEE